MSFIWAFISKVMAVFPSSFDVTVLFPFRGDQRPRSLSCLSYLLNFDFFGAFAFPTEVGRGPCDYYNNTSEWALVTWALICLTGKGKLLVLRHFMKFLEQRNDTPTETDMDVQKGSWDRQFQSFWNLLHCISQRGCACFGMGGGSNVSYCKCDISYFLHFEKSYIHGRSEN